MSAPAAEGLFDRHHLVVFRFLRRMTGDANLAEDLTQEVFVRVVRGLDGYVERDRERAWVFRIARNVIVDHHRESQRRPDPAPLDDALAAVQPATQTMAAALHQALARLPVEEREAFLMREVAGLGYAEIEEAMGASRNAARMRIYRARQALRDALPDWRGLRASR
jgi:RNA polymerase sigma-70 factor (ECF subfamily)